MQRREAVFFPSNCLQLKLYEQSSPALHELIRWAAYPFSQGKSYFFFQVVGGKVNMS